MSLLTINSESDGVSVYYGNIENDFGFYRSRPDTSPFICLDESLLHGSDSQHRAVYQTLLNYHNSLDTWDRLVPIVIYFKQLVPPEGIPQPEIVGPEIVFIGRAVRVWHYSFNENEDQYRAIGSKAG